MSALMAAKRALRGWRTLNAQRRRHQAIMHTIVTRVLQRQQAAALAAWRSYTAACQAEKHAYDKIVKHNVHRVWRSGCEAWRFKLKLRQKLARARQGLKDGLCTRVLRHWAAHVAHKQDWRAFEAQAVHKMRLARWVGFSNTRIPVELIRASRCGVRFAALHD